MLNVKGLTIVSLVLGAAGATMVTTAWSAMGVAVWASGGRQTKPVPSANLSQAAAPTASEPLANLNDAAALNDKYGIEAAAACDGSSDEYIQTAGQGGYKWNESGLSFFGARFDKYQGSVSQPGVITLTSDKLSVQQASSTDTRVTFSCQYSTQTQKVLGYQIQR